MKSMTGHGRGTALANGVRVVAECFSVNRRQAEVALRESEYRARQIIETVPGLLWSAGPDGETGINEKRRRI
jgi:PAS domain-containing protein